MRTFCLLTSSWKNRGCRVTGHPCDLHSRYLIMDMHVWKYPLYTLQAAGAQAQAPAKVEDIEAAPFANAECVLPCNGGLPHGIHSLLLHAALALTPVPACVRSMLQVAEAAEAQAVARATVEAVVAVALANAERDRLAAEAVLRAELSAAAATAAKAWTLTHWKET